MGFLIKSNLANCEKIRYDFSNPILHRENDIFSMGVTRTMKSKKLLWLFALMLVLSLVLAACAGDGESDSEGESGESESGSEESGSEEDSSESDSEDSEGEEASGGDGSNDVVLAVSSDIVSLDPHIENDVPSSNVRDNIYETLVEQDSDMNIVEGLADRLGTKR